MSFGIKDLWRKIYDERSKKLWFNLVKISYKSPILKPKENLDMQSLYMQTPKENLHMQSPNTQHTPNLHTQAQRTKAQTQFFSVNSNIICCCFFFSFFFFVGKVIKHYNFTKQINGSDENRQWELDCNQPRKTYHTHTHKKKKKKESEKLSNKNDNFFFYN